MPHSIFMGRVVTAGEPQFLPRDTDLALAWKIESDHTHRCGFPIDECFHPDAEYEGEALVCKACQAKDIAEKNVRDGGGPDMYGLFSRAWKVD